MFDVFYGDVGDDGRGFTENNLLLVPNCEEWGSRGPGHMGPLSGFFLHQADSPVSGIYLDLWMSIEATSMLSQGAPRFYIFFSR